TASPKGNLATPKFEVADRDLVKIVGHAVGQAFLGVLRQGDVPVAAVEMEGIKARAVAIAAFTDGLKNLGTDGKTRGAIADDRCADKVFQHLLALAEVFHQVAFFLSMAQGMSVAMGGDFMPPVPYFLNQGRQALGDPSQDK